jgi:mRNA interferase RelE/StbE
MKYSVELKPKAIKDLEAVPKEEATRIYERLRMLEDDLHGDVKKLTNFTPEYRMRAGNYRALFEIEGDRVIIYRILHRKESYR